MGGIKKKMNRGKGNEKIIIFGGKYL